MTCQQGLSLMAPPRAGCYSTSGCSPPPHLPLSDHTVPAGTWHCCTSGCLTLLHLRVLDPVAWWVLHLLSQQGLPWLCQRMLVITPLAGALPCYSTWALGTTASLEGACNCYTSGCLIILHVYQQVLDNTAPAGACRYCTCGVLDLVAPVSALH